MMQDLKIAIARHPLRAFVGLAYAITWLLWAPSISAARGLLPLDLPPWASLPGSFGPLLAAVILATLLGGDESVRLLLGKLLRWRVRLRWYIIALGLPLALNVALLSMFGWLSGLPITLAPQSLFALTGAFLFWTVFGGPLGEEPGWRGFALPLLMRERSALQASLWIALIWFGWHLPRYLDPNLTGGNGLGVILLFAVQALVFSVLHTWVYVRSGHSLLLVVLFHGAINTIGYMIPMLYPTATPADVSAYAGPLTLAGLAVLILWAGGVALLDRSLHAGGGRGGRAAKVLPPAEPVSRPTGST